MSDIDWNQIVHQHEPPPATTLRSVWRDGFWLGFVVGVLAMFVYLVIALLVDPYFKPAHALDATEFQPMQPRADYGHDDLLIPAPRYYCLDPAGGNTQDLREGRAAIIPCPTHTRPVATPTPSPSCGRGPVIIEREETCIPDCNHCSPIAGGGVCTTMACSPVTRTVREAWSDYPECGGKKARVFVEVE